jgi:transposase-like protein
MSKKRKRRQFKAEQKVAILREHLIDRVAVSDVCEKNDIQPSLFYYWQRQFFENGAAAFSSDRDSERRQLERQVDKLEKKLAHKDYVIARVSEEFVKAKKEFGEP